MHLKHFQAESKKQLNSEGNIVFWEKNATIRAKDQKPQCLNQGDAKFKREKQWPSKFIQKTYLNKRKIAES